MKVIEHLAQAKAPPISFEIIPPKRGDNIQQLLRVVEELARWKPPFIDITSHPAEVLYRETPAGRRRRIVRRRPGTLGICALVQNQFGIDAVPHVLCRSFTQQETEDFLIELRYLGIDNVLLLTGDEKGAEKPFDPDRMCNRYAVDLVRQVQNMNQGRYLEEPVDQSPTNFCVGVAGYPEKHMASPDVETDLRHTKAKVAAGADYIVTQMFFNNEHYFRYVRLCRDAGIDVPIIPGLKVLRSRRQLETIPKLFACEIPERLASEIHAANEAEVEDIGVRWAVDQGRQLLELGAPALHFYVMLNARLTSRVVEQLR